MCVGVLYFALSLGMDGVINHPVSRVKMSKSLSKSLSLSPNTNTHVWLDTRVSANKMQFKKVKIVSEGMTWRDRSS